ncbi:MAG: nucleotidyltransferase domain-containing protein [Armatimonadota bacterium]|nr:nucleotidyltransferase domain-containing protein [Armatimonadota bacterium]MDR7535855.1 nucleotidyltransferase domain-containing protein [Armatimonadota bacterium]
MQSQAPEHNVAALTVQALSKALGDRLVAVALFGSRARGQADQESDWDLLVVVQGLPESPLERLIFLKQLLPPGCEAVSFLARTPEEFEDHSPSLYLDIALDGKILYDPRGYLAERLSHLRRLIEDLGLYREWTEEGYEWRWRKQPTGPWAPRLKA